MPLSRPLAALGLAAALSAAGPRLQAVEAMVLNTCEAHVWLRVEDAAVTGPGSPFQFARLVDGEMTEPAPFPGGGMPLPMGGCLWIQVADQDLAEFGSSLRLRVNGPGGMRLGSLLVQFLPDRDGARSVVTPVAGRTHVAEVVPDRDSPPGRRCWFLDDFRALAREAPRSVPRTRRAVAPAPAAAAAPAAPAAAPAAPRSGPSCAIL